jgi:CTP synthase (UTP-ammonia lyase)
MIQAAKGSRENRIPYLGICVGMQLAVIESLAMFATSQRRGHLNCMSSVQTL